METLIHTSKLANVCKVNMVKKNTKYRKKGKEEIEKIMLRINMTEVGKVVLSGNIQMNFLQGKKLIRKKRK